MNAFFRILLLTLVVLTGVAPASAQKGNVRSAKTNELGISLGTAYYIGELNPSKPFGTQEKLCAGLSLRHNFNLRWAVKGSFNYGNIEAHDSKSKDPWQQNRNLNFRNRFFEGAVVFELNFFDYQLGTGSDISPYLFLGTGLCYSNPEAQYNGFWHSLQPAGTEGQGMKGYAPYYKQTIFVMPMGFGLKMNLGQKMGLDVEWGMRKTWSDYFDDVSENYVDPALLMASRGQLTTHLADQSLQQMNGTNALVQRGESSRKDLYFFCMATLNIRLAKKLNTCWKG